MKDCREFLEYCKIIEEYSNNMDDYPYIYDLKNDRYYIVKKAVDRFNIKENLFSNVNEAHSHFVYVEDFPMLNESLTDMVEGRADAHDLEYRWLDDEKEPIWIHCRGKIIDGEEAKRQFMIGCISEMGQHREADNNTGLRSFSSIREEFDRLTKNGAQGYLAIIGLDGYDKIVSRKGIQFADHLVKDIVRLFRNKMEDDQELFYEGRSTIIVLNKNRKDFKEVRKMYDKVRTIVDNYIENHNYEAVFTLSAGAINLCEIEEISYAEVLKRATFALSMAINHGKNQIYEFSAEEYKEFCKKQELLTKLNSAVSRGFKGFQLYYQPIVNYKTGKLEAAESLCRFFEEDGKMVSPMDFIPLLEESGLIIPVGRWIIREAVQMCLKVQKYIPNFRITVNLSYVQILKSPIKDRILEALNEAGLAKECFVVELTESGYLENTPSVRTVWDKLRDNGVKIALDDFGTGYSNFDNISKLAPNLVKIDRGFTVKALQDNYMLVLLDNIIRMCHGLGLKVCIEGIETKEELDIIGEMDPDFIQGFYYGKPSPENIFMESYVENN